MIKKLLKEEQVTTETRLDFNKTLSAWLVKQGFERKEDKFTSNPIIVVYAHKELPIKIKPRKNENVWFGDYDLSFVECAYFKMNGQGQLSVFKSTNSQEGQVLLDKIKKSFDEALELAKKVVAHIKKGDYL